MLQRILAVLLSAHLILVPASAFATQASLFSPTTGTVSGLNLTNNFNSALDSLNTMNSGASAPTNQLSGTPSAFNRWCNTTANPYPCNVYDGAQWLTPYYVDATNHLIINQIGGGLPANIASAATVDLCSTPSSRISIGGSTTITSFGSSCPVGIYKSVVFVGVMTLTYNATSLIVPGAANITTAAGDQAIVYQYAAGDWDVVAYTPANGQALLNPSIDVGDVVFTHLTAPPSAKYLFEYGQPISRTTYATLLNSSMYPTFSGITATSGSPTLVGFSDTTQICSGQATIEATFLPSGPYPTIVSCTSSSVTLNRNAIASTTGSVQVFPYGDGDGASTFNLPDCRGLVMAGRDNMGGTPRSVLTSQYFTHNPDALGATGGSQDFALAAGNIPQVTGSYTPAGTIGGSQSFSTYATSGSPLTGVGSSGAPQTITINGSNFTFTGTPATITVGSASPSAVGNIPPTITANCMVRVLSLMTPIRGVPAPDAANDNQLAAIEPRLLAG